MTKILIRKEVTTMQTVGATSRPSIMDLGRAAFLGQGAMNTDTGIRNRVGAGGQIAGLVGLAGKGAGATAAAFQTAQALQGGNTAAPLQAGVTYQGLDPTGATMGGAIQGQAPPAPVAVQTPLPPVPQQTNVPPVYQTGYQASPAQNVPPGLRDGRGNLIPPTTGFQSNPALSPPPQQQQQQQQQQQKHQPYQ